MKPAQAFLVAIAAAWTPSIAVLYEGWKAFPYCNDIELLRNTRVTPLEAEQRARVESLAQVQIVARHGSRAPYARVMCWDEANHDPTDANWTCSTTSVSSQDIGYKAPSGYGRLYGKTYLDGLNILNGSCVVGALLPEGREQHRLNGQLLREAYIGDGPLQLFNSSTLENIPKGSIYLRSDDEERTLGSGQALVDGFFPPDNFHPALDAMLHWHVADISTDYIDTNYRICKAMGHFARLATLAPALQAHITSTATAKFEDSVRKLLGRFSWDTIYECLSVSRCNRMPLPKGIDEAMFDKITHEVELRQGAFLTHNNSWFAKLAMQPMIHDLVTRIDHVVHPLSSQNHSARLAITVGHDTTIMPLLAALLRENWDRKWTPFAGLFVLELYKLKTHKFAVRLLMSGQVLQVPECSDTLCDLDQFMQAVSFARTPRDCAIPIARFSLSTVLDGLSNVVSSAGPSGLMLIALASMCVMLAIGYRRERTRRLTGESQRLLPSYSERS